ncbi:MAG: LemA family protein [Eubacteriaceae bacterium]|jgi:LemA protein
MTWLWIILAVIVILLIWLIVVRNGLVQASNQIEEAYSTMDVYMKKRYDLIPNLVNTVKGYAAHEKETLLAVEQASMKASHAGSVEEQAKDEEALNGAVKNLFALAQAYPDLKANQNYLDLQNQLKKIEEDIANARKYYNASVRVYNDKISTFPGSIFAGGMHFEKKPYFQVASEAERQNVNVQF